MLRSFSVLICGGHKLLQAPAVGLVSLAQMGAAHAFSSGGLLINPWGVSKNAAVTIAPK